ncbi:LysM peptidoglycan-binding domain-containing protein [Lactiplantibacillus pingfangensis]|uniref:LysM peptidoglycan-binding domain-containing protein n=1 Tax=Lactiplantibacillus pingfangensis TaxID=2559915 RepID=UPI0010F6C743|nr:LysM peptidoglycan-binding domain-containing protein [Lactiplantibacillus pingfangensis]
MKKFINTILTTSAATLGLLLAGAVTANADTTYTVKAGDSVWAISQHYGPTIAAIEAANQIQNNLIFPGQVLTLPGVDGPTATSAPVTSPVVAPTATPQPSVPATQPSTQTRVSSTTQSAATAAPVSSSYTGHNLQSYVLTQMAARTGVSADTWNHIITRESGWQPQVQNSSSGAYGLFQNIHISSGSVDSQVNAAVNLYHAQGMGAWAL